MVRMLVAWELSSRVRLRCQVVGVHDRFSYFRVGAGSGGARLSGKVAWGRGGGCVCVVH